MGRWKKTLAGLVVICAILAHQNCQEKGSESSLSTSSYELNLAASSDTQSAHDALQIYQRLTGTKIAVDHPIISEMATLIDQSQIDEAINKALADDDFYNITVRDLATVMSNREETPLATLNDFVATFIGAVRDDLDARELLTGNFYYSAPTDAPHDLKDDLITSNRHYQTLDENGRNLAQVLQRQEPQKVLSDGKVIDLEDTAGLLTSRGFLKAHATDGTNRRLVEFSFSQFLCRPINEWASTRYPDNRVGRDIGRSPISEYRNKCVACHAPMDAMRPAFAYFNFESEMVSYRKPFSFDPREDDVSIVDVPVPSDEQFIPSKFRRASDVYPEGFVVKDDHWENYTFTNSAFGWRVQQNGHGVNAFGHMLANSRAFSECLTKRVFKAICGRELEDSGLLRDLADRFETHQYNLKNLFSVAIRQPECLGLHLGGQ